MNVWVRILISLGIFALAYLFIKLIQKNTKALGVENKK